MSYIDRYLDRFPGTISQKAFVSAMVVCAAIGYPIFREDNETRPGHDYFSHEKPEAIRAGEERMRRERRKLMEEQKQQSDKS
jgi:hypothetical protein